jgi:predicted DNA-binding transcriptional regulator YafY
VEARSVVNRFDRALGILLLLRGGGIVSATTLAERFEVSTRTIYRDVDALGALGVPVIAEPGRCGGFRLQAGYFLPPIMFSRGEALSLVLGVTMLRGLSARPYAADLDSGKEKLVAALPPALRFAMTDAERVIGFEGIAGDAFHTAPEAAVATARRDVANEGRVVEVFLEAALNRRTVYLRYRSPYRPAATARSVLPRGIFADRDLWYLVGAPTGGGSAARLWRADRVLEIRAQTRPTEVDPAFDVRRLLDRRWLAMAMTEWTRQSRVTIRLTAAQAERLGRDWYYGRAAFTATGDGRIELTFGEDEATVVMELMRWLGPGAELIEPVAWRSLLGEELEEMRRSYAKETDA